MMKDFSVNGVFPTAGG